MMTMGKLWVGFVAASHFSLLRSAIACVRGARSSIGHVYRAPQSLDVICVESHLNINDQ